MKLKDYVDQNQIISFFETSIEKIKEVKDLDKTKTNLPSFNLDEVITEIMNEIKELKLLMSQDETTWQEFSIQYQLYYTNRLNHIKNFILNFLHHNISNELNEQMYDNLMNSIFNLHRELKRDSIFELYELFKSGDTNYILFGKNGAGKTTLLKKISSELLNSNTIVLPATRDIKYAENPNYNQDEIDLKKALQLNNGVYNLGGKSLFLLGKVFATTDYEMYTSGCDVNKTITNVVYSIFNQLGLDRVLVLDNKGKLFLKETTPYSFLFASDGERSAVYIILTVLLAPQNSFIFIDEPENHLNGALMRKLFDLLEKERPDVRFIFATHNIQFIQSRQNTQLIYLEKTSSHNQWKFKKLDDCKKLSLEVILSIEGTNDNVIFCEGEDRQSLDCKLYEILFPNYEIVPVHGCENVIKQTELLNEYKTVFKREAIGIVDCDFRENNDIVRLGQKNIKTLKTNEVENVFMLTPCLEVMSDVVGNNKTIEEIQNKIIARIGGKQDSIKQDYATKLLRNIQLQNKFKKSNNVEIALDELLESNKNIFLEKYKSFEKELSESIKLKKYDKLMKIVPGKMLLSDVANVIGFANDNLYTNKLLLQIKSDERLREKIYEHCFDKKV